MRTKTNTNYSSLPGNNINMPFKAPPFSQEIEEYITLNGWQRLNSSIIPDALIFMKDNTRGLVLIDDSIEYKEAEEKIDNNAAQILFNWVSKKHYRGFDGKNIFQLMLLLDFMGVILLKDVDKELRQSINIKNMVESLPVLHN